jgi:KDO2-lipid IV(A) lauroyltransferase
MKLLNESFLCAVIKLLSVLFCRLPYRVNIAIARALGHAGYYLMGKKRLVVEANLRTAFPEMALSDVHRLSKKVFENFFCSCMDVLYIPQVKAQGYDKTLTFNGTEHMTKALEQGKGCILLAVHSGSWELASIAGSMVGHPYNIVANEHSKALKLDDMLNEYRRMTGAKVIPAGIATREIIRALQGNEVVSLVLDQGGKDGVAVDFFGKKASMSTGAIRLGLKYQTPVCPAWIEREPSGRQNLTIFPPLKLQSTNDMEKDIVTNTQSAVRMFEKFFRANPSENMWFYKIYKYTTQADVLILDDGKTGHLRQSQTVAEALRVSLGKTNKETRVKTVTIEFKNKSRKKLFVFYCVLAQIFRFLRQEEALKSFLKENSYKELMRIKPDYLISCGSQTAGVNFILSRLWSVKPIHILTPSLLDWRWFSLVILPEHDKPLAERLTRVLLTKVALNLITPSYLKQQEEKLLLRYSHLKNNVRSKIGVLIGGDTKGVVFDVNQIRLLIHQLKDAAEHYNMDMLVTTSRRTPSHIDQMITKELKNFNRCSLLILPNESNIPEAVGGILALSDILVVSGESISMVSEAVSSGKKTIVFAPTGSFSQISLNKYERFVLDLNQQGYLLACSIKDISNTLTQIMSRKISVKAVDDRSNLLKEIESLLK